MEIDTKANSVMSFSMVWVCLIRRMAQSMKESGSEVSHDFLLIRFSDCV
jgi:hypothetical protein